jgi:hypothetical protein
MSLQLLFTGFYGVLLLIILVLVGFVAFHLFRYSLSRTHALFSTLFFIFTTGVLVCINMIIFSQIPWSKLESGSMDTVPSVPAPSFRF